MLFLKKGAMLFKKIKQLTKNLNSEIQENGQYSAEDIIKTDIMDQVQQNLEQIIFDFRFNNLI